jgi:hypothetical protein
MVKHLKNIPGLKQNTFPLAKWGGDKLVKNKVIFVFVIIYCLKPINILTTIENNIFQ